jgi:hypothetical protein
VDQFFTDSDALWTLAALVPLGLAAAAWALQMACGFCSVDPPEFWHAFTTVVIIAVANTVLRFVLHATDSAGGFGSQYLAPALAMSGVICVSLPTGPFSAITIAVVQIALCSMIYFSLAWLQATIVAAIMMM